MKRFAFALLIQFCLPGLSFATSNNVIHHQLEIQLFPALKSLTVQDELLLQAGKTFRFLLHKNLHVTATSTGDQLRLLQSDLNQTFNEYELRTGPQDSTAVLQYSGIIFDPVTNNSSSGLISPEGVALFGSSYWLPDFESQTTYEITKMALPDDWRLASPRTQRRLPQEQIYLIAGKFHEYRPDNNESRDLDLKIFLRQSDPALAQTFLNLIPGYLGHYQKTIGAFPYESFAVIENFWETGFGMPGFTLLGPSVIRLPFILNSSLPHEVLHNWWGNSVYVDYDRGNWCEGLTTYLADHWQQELLKADTDYRRQALMSFQDYTQTSPDFPLREFKQRHSFSSQAIGYGKGMMLFHMLKLRLGDSLFRQGLQDLYNNHRGQRISYEEIESSFARTSGANLTSFFKQWLDRTGAPKIQLDNVTLTSKNTDSKTSAQVGFEVGFELRQIAPQSYELDIPVRWTLRDGSIQKTLLKLSQDKSKFISFFKHSPRSLEIDPDFEVWRELALEERPVSLSNVFGAKKIFILGTSPQVSEAFLQTWKKTLEAKITLEKDQLLHQLPSEGAILMLGDSAEYEKIMQEELAGQKFELNSEELRIFGVGYSRHEHKSVIATRSRNNPNLVLLWVRGAEVESLAPRLLHYGKYGILIFSAKGPHLKSTWPLLRSPLKVDWP